MQLPDIAWLGEPACHDVTLTGGKAAALSRLAAHHSVPPGFCVTTAACARAYGGRLVAHLGAAIAAAYHAFPAGPPTVAVRSSAADEDGAATSFAGVHESMLNVHGSDALLAAVEYCLESFYAERALAYRREHGLGDTPRAAVLVQQQIQSDVSIVAFSANPVTRNRDEIVVTASWGLGESLVGGTVTPDSWWVGRDGSLVAEHLGDKRRMTVAVAGGVREVDVPRVLRSAATLQPEQVAEVARLATALEVETGGPVDIECAVAGGRLYLLQCRPITTLNNARSRGTTAAETDHE